MGHSISMSLVHSSTSDQNVMSWRFQSCCSRGSIYSAEGAISYFQSSSHICLKIAPSRIILLPAWIHAEVAELTMVHNFWKPWIYIWVYIWCTLYRYIYISIYTSIYGYIAIYIMRLYILYIYIYIIYYIILPHHLVIGAHLHSTMPIDNKTTS